MIVVIDFFDFLNKLEYTNLINQPEIHRSGVSISLGIESEKSVTMPAVENLEYHTHLIMSQKTRNSHHFCFSIG